MATIPSHQEVLIMADTSFPNHPFRSGRPSRARQLEEACRNGLLAELLPEILTLGSAGLWLPLRHIRNSGSLLQVELSGSPKTLEHQLSIDPYRFLPLMPGN